MLPARSLPIEQESQPRRALSPAPRGPDRVSPLLSDRERTILRLMIGEGLPNKQASGLSPRSGGASAPLPKRTTAGWPFGRVPRAPDLSR